MIELGMDRLGVAMLGTLMMTVIIQVASATTPGQLSVSGEKTIHIMP